MRSTFPRNCAHASGAPPAAFRAASAAHSHAARMCSKDSRISSHRSSIVRCIAARVADSVDRGGDMRTRSGGLSGLSARARAGVSRIIAGQLKIFKRASDDTPARASIDRTRERDERDERANARGLRSSRLASRVTASVSTTTRWMMNCTSFEKISRRRTTRRSRAR